MILFENADVLALDKPAGVSMATSSRPGSAEEAVRRLLAAGGLAAEEPMPLLVHRLDVGTSGVVLLAKNDTAHRALSRALQQKTAQKTYRALVWGRPVPARGTVDLPLARDPKDGRKMRAGKDGKPSVTRYETLKRYAGLADLRVFPETGRTHQIRVHLSAKGHPIAGDDFYGGATRWRGVKDPALRGALRRLSRPLLHAERIAVPEMGIDVASPLPKDYEEILRLCGGC
ncbi:MAG TPA: RluA family pseudouridine synthase [Thermoanaerobaculia bacterium]|nr:RluA family pseudouridine synthase [Thermoanaerobaculia bacterium]